MSRRGPQAHRAEHTPRPTESSRRRCQHQAGGCHDSAVRWAPSRSGACWLCSVHQPRLPQGPHSPPGCRASRGHLAEGQPTLHGTEGTAEPCSLGCRLSRWLSLPLAPCPQNHHQARKGEAGAGKCCEHTGGPSRDTCQHLMQRQSAEVQ